MQLTEKEVFLRICCNYNFGTDSCYTCLSAPNRIIHAMMLRKTNYAALKNRLVKGTKVYLIHASKNMKCHRGLLNFLKSHLVYEVKVTNSCIRFLTDILVSLLLFYLQIFVDSEIFMYTYSSVKDV